MCPDNVGLVGLRPLQDEDGGPDARNIEIIGNVFQVGSAKAMRVRGVRNLSVVQNRFENSGMTVEQTSKFVEISQSSESP